MKEPIPHSKNSEIGRPRAWTTSPQETARIVRNARSQSVTGLNHPVLGPELAREKFGREEVHVFIGGSTEDPRPASNEFSKRFARCLTELHQNVICHFSRALLKWVDDGGHFHSDCVIEFPLAWLQAQGVLETEP